MGDGFLRMYFVGVLNFGGMYSWRLGGWVGGKVNRKVEVDFWGRCGGGDGKNVE